MAFKVDQFFLLALLAVLISISITSFYIGFDFTDEGLYLYLLSHGSVSTFLSPFHIILNPLGTLFNHSLIGYRFLNLVMLLACYLILANQINGFLKLENRLFLFVWLTLGIPFHFSDVSTISYNSVSTMSAVLWLATIIHYYKSSSTASLFFVGLCIFAGFLGRPPFGVILLVVTPIILWGIDCIEHQDSRRYQSGLIAFGSATAFIALFALANLDFSRSLLSIYATNIASSHQGLLSAYYSQLNEFVGEYRMTIIWPMLLPLCSRLLESVSPHRSKMILWGIMVSYLASLAYEVDNFSQGDKGETIMFLTAISLGIALAISLQLFLQWKVRPSNQRMVFRCLFIVLASMNLGILSSVGTNGNIVRFVAFSFPLVTASAAVTLCQLQAVARHGRLISCLIATVYFSVSSRFLLDHQVLAIYRTAPAHELVHRSNLPKMAGVSLDRDLALTLDKLNFTLTSIGFDYDEDRLFAYPDLPGDIAATKAIAFGNSWNITFYENSDVSNCNYIENEPNGSIRYVYLLVGKPLTEALSSCLYERITPSGELKSFSIGKGFHYRNRYEYSLELIGPYRLIVE